MSYYRPISDSPVEKLRKQLPKGDGNWKGYSTVYHRLQQSAEYLARGFYSRLSEDHVKTMAVMGCGHEETMKAHMHMCLTYGWARISD